MNFVAAVLLMHMGGEDAFWVFATFLDNVKYMHNFYTPSLSGLLVRDIYLRADASL